MEEFLDSWRPRFLSVLRIMVGLLLIPHGTAKFFGWPDTGREGGVELFSLIGLAATIEIVGGLLLVIGLFTRSAAFVVSGFLAAAYFMAHAPRAFQPIVNEGELAVLWCFVAFYIFVAGAGPWSVDAALEGEKHRPVYTR